MHVDLVQLKSNWIKLIFVILIFKTLFHTLCKQNSLRAKNLNPFGVYMPPRLGNYYPETSLLLLSSLLLLKTNNFLIASANKTLFCLYHSRFAERDKNSKTNPNRPQLGGLKFSVFFSRPFLTALDSTKV